MPQSVPLGQRHSQTIVEDLPYDQPSGSRFTLAMLTMRGKTAKKKQSTCNLEAKHLRYESFHTTHLHSDTIAAMPAHVQSDPIIGFSGAAIQQIPNPRIKNPKIKNRNSKFKKSQIQHSEFPNNKYNIEGSDPIAGVCVLRSYR